MLSWDSLVIALSTWMSRLTRQLLNLESCMPNRLRALDVGLDDTRPVALRYCTSSRCLAVATTLRP